MKTLRRALAYFILGLIILQLQAYSVGFNIAGSLSNRILYLIPVLVIITGMLVGLLSYVFIQQSKRTRSFFIVGLDISFISFVMLVCVFRFQTWRENQRYGYGYNSQRILKSTDKRGLDYIATGFKAFQAEIASPRDLAFESYTSRPLVTRGAEGLDTAHIIYYAYFFKDDKTKYFSKLSVSKDGSKILIFNGIAGHNAEYDSLSNDKNYGTPGVIDSAKPRQSQNIIEALENRY